MMAVWVPVIINDENNGYVYRWDVQHNIVDLISLIGGNEAFTSALIPCSIRRWVCLNGNSIPRFRIIRVTGMFSMANEPSLHIPYLYNYAGKP